MNRLNTKSLGQAMDIFDTDTMDIARRTQIINPDGTIGETGIDTPIYSGVACHIDFQDVDNPNPNTAATRPINKILKIHCDETVDLQNGDYITAYRRQVDGTLIETYIGVIGDPSTYMGRKVVEMAVRQDV